MIALDCSQKGSCHDFTVLKESKTYFSKDKTALMDSGYQGQQKRQKNTQIPHKKPKNKKLTPQQKAENKALAKKETFN